MPTDEQIEAAADKMIAGEPLTRAEQRLLDSPQADVAMGQVRAVLEAKPTRTGRVREIVRANKQGWKP